MTSTRDEVIEGTAEVEQLLRAYGAQGRGFGEMIHDLAARGVLPKRIKSQALDANRMRNRVVHEAAVLNAVEMEMWSRGVTAVHKWVRAQSGGAATERSGASTSRRPSGSRGPRKFPAPWALTAIVTVVIGAAASALYGAQGATGDFLQPLQAISAKWSAPATSPGATKPPEPAEPKSQHRKQSRSHTSHVERASTGDEASEQ